MVRVRRGGAADAPACLALAASLPRYFTASALPPMRADLERHDLYVAEEAEAGAGAGLAAFASIRPRSLDVADLSWLAVHPERQGRGIGTALLSRVAIDLASRGVRLLTVRTLAEEAGYAPYARTLRFYRRAGFLHVETVDPYPGWEPGTRAPSS